MKATRRIHLIAPAGSATAFLEQLGVGTTAGLVDLVDELLGSTYSVTANDAIVEALEQEAQGGRNDDVARARDIQEALSDSNVAAVVMIRGGAWFTRILPLIDFGVLDIRTRPVAVFGFSELTTLVGIVASHPMGVGIYDLGPAFLPYGLRRHAVSLLNNGGLPTATNPQGSAQTPGAWARAHLRGEFESYFRDVRSMIEGRGTGRPIEATHLSGRLADRQTTRIVGGNLTVLSTVLGSRYEGAFKPQGGWLFLEDFNDKIERIDRFLAHLSLSDMWGHCTGLLLGDFHQSEQDQLAAVLALLDYHLPSDRSLPILSCATLGHVWPLSPLACNVLVEISRVSGETYTITWNPGWVATVECPDIGLSTDYSD